MAGLAHHAPPQLLPRPADAVAQRWLKGLWGFALAVFVAALALRPLDETDVFFRLATGQQVLQRHALVRHNLFSFTHPNQPYFDSAWLFDVGAALLFRSGGFAGLVAAKTAWLVGVFVGAFALARRKGATPGVAAVVLAAAALVVEPRIVERPHLLSFGFALATLAVVHATRKRAIWVASVAPLVALWANLHAGAFVAPLLFTAAAVGAFVDRRWKRGERTPAAGPGKLLLAALAAAIALLATPFGAGIFRYLGFHVGIHAIHPVDEFRPPDLHSDLPFWIAFATTAVVMGAWARRLPVSWRDWLPVLVVAALACRYVRFAADFALLSAPVVAARVTALLKAAPRVGQERRWSVAVPAVVAAVASLA
ncbi:MAG TPA: hypothetical protein VGG33_18150, partial [Polyangia bacterium]